MMFSLVCVLGSSSLCWREQFVIYGNISKNCHERKRYIPGDRWVYSKAMEGSSSLHTTQWSL